MFHAATFFDSTYTDAMLETELEITNESAIKVDSLSLYFALKDKTGKDIALKQATKSIRMLEAGTSEKIGVSFLFLIRRIGIGTSQFVPL